jgi:hypothetical protein
VAFYCYINQYLHGIGTAATITHVLPQQTIPRIGTSANTTQPLAPQPIQLEGYIMATHTPLEGNEQFLINSAQLQFLVNDAIEQYAATNNEYYAGQRDAWRSILYGMLNPLPTTTELAGYFDQSKTKPIRSCDYDYEQATKR